MKGSACSSRGPEACVTQAEGHLDKNGSMSPVTCPSPRCVNDLLNLARFLDAHRFVLTVKASLLYLHDTLALNGWELQVDVINCIHFLWNTPKKKDFPFLLLLWHVVRMTSWNTRCVSGKQGDSFTAGNAAVQEAFVNYNTQRMLHHCRPEKQNNGAFCR